MRLWVASLMLGALALSSCSDRVAQKPKRDYKYKVISREVLGGISDTELVAAVMEYVDFRIGDDYEHEYKIVTGLSKGFQAIYCTSCVEGEVYNGGFNQYFWNPSGQFRREALEGYTLLGANEHAAIVQEALPVWSEADFRDLLSILGCAGYGWLRPEGVRRELQKMAATWQGPPPLAP
jgi:hypothetical protein